MQQIGYTRRVIPGAMRVVSRHGNLHLAEALTG
jgi:hypothetical protein